MFNLKKLSAFLLTCAVTLSIPAAVLAEPAADDAAQQEALQQDAAQDGAVQQQTPADPLTSSTYYNGQDAIYMEDPNFTEPDTSHAGAALLMDMNSGRLIYGKNVTARMFPASTTKMMTAILALESGKMGDTVTASYEALQSITLQDSHMGILIGEELTMNALINGMMVYSANDAANVIAIHIGGSIDNFVAMMNQKAMELGMNNTHFMNPCGVHDDNHYTTAQDLAILAQYCMQNEWFREIVKQPSYHIDPTNKYMQNRDLPNTNLFLGTSRSANYYYKPCTGIKTGTTDAAGHCLVASAEYNNMRLLTVVLKCDDKDVKENAYSYIDTRSLFDFGFNNYRAGVLATPGNIVADSKVREAKDDKRVTLTVDADVNALVPADNNNIASEVETVVTLNDNITAPIAKGDQLGQVSYVYRSTEIGRATLVAANDVEQNIFLHYLHIIISIVTNPLVFIPAIFIAIIILIAKARKRRRDRKRMIQQLRQRKAYDTGANNRRTSSSEINRTRSKSSNSRYSGDRRR